MPEPADGPRHTRILLISDLHMGEPAKEYRHRLLTTEVTADQLSRRIREALEVHRDTRQQFDYLVVAGDVVSTTTDQSELRARYLAANAQLSRLADDLGFGGQRRKRVLILPGNHDVFDPKGASGTKPCERLNDYSNFLALFFDGQPEALLNSTFSVKESPDGQTTIQREQWLVEGDDVVFWPLITCCPWNHDLNQDGLLRDDDVQVVRGTTALRSLGENDPRCRIAVVHHNFLFADYQKVKGDRQGAIHNPMHTLKSLFDGEVLLVLHGHRHQDYALGFGDWQADDSPFEHNRLVIGTPSIGYYEDRPDAGPDDLAGFVVIDIERHGRETSAWLRKYHLEERDGSWTANRPIVRHVALKRHVKSAQFMTFAEGYQRFTKEALCSTTREARTIILLHYQPDVAWENVFGRFWGLDNANALRYLTGWFRGDPHSVLKDGQFTEGVVNKLSHLKAGLTLRDAILRTVAERRVPQDLEDDHFLRHICRLANADGEAARALTYVLEALHCATFPKTILRKHIHISPTSPGNSATEKFAWLLESLMMCQGLNNISFSWLPFAIRGYQGRSLVGLRRGSENDKGDTDAFFVGFDPAEYRASVLHLPEDIGRQGPEGPILNDLKALMRKIINPLSCRIGQDFPLYVGGTLDERTLLCMSRVARAEKIWKTSIGARFCERFNTNEASIYDQSTADIETRLHQLHSWVLFSGGAQEKWQVPWQYEDCVDIVTLVTSPIPAA